MENYTRIIGATSTNIATPTAPQINQGNDPLTPYNSAKNNGFYNEMSQQIGNISEELTNLITSQGLTPDGTLTQVEEAINLVVSDVSVDSASQLEVDAGVIADKYVAPSTLAGLFANTNLASNGHASILIKDGGIFKNLIIQYGSNIAAANGFTTYTFPRSFPNAVLAAVGNKTQGSPTGVDAADSGIYSISNTQFNAFSDDGSRTISWIAIGY